MNKALKILLATDGLVFLAGAMLGPIYAIYVEDIGGDLLTAGASWAVFSLVSGITIYLIGKFEDRVKEKELSIALGYFIISLGFLGYLFVKSLFGLFVVQVVIGLGGAVFLPAFDATYSKHLAVKRAASQWGSWEAMSRIVTAIGALGGSLIVKFFGFPTLFILMFILALSSAIFIYFLPRKVL